MRYQIWESSDGSESGMFVEDHPQHEFLTYDTSGNKMTLVKDFEAETDDDARDVYTKFKDFKGEDDGSSN